MEDFPKKSSMEELQAQEEALLAEITECEKQLKDKERPDEERTKIMYQSENAYAKLDDVRRQMLALTQESE